jgi:hypothetical protein
LKEALQKIGFSFSMKFEKKHWFILPVFALMAWLSQELMLYVVKIVQS